MTPNTGGPAFPGPYANENGNIEVLFKQQGMTLRDYFAAKVLQGAMVNATGLPHESDETLQMIGEQCYRIADGMLKAREAQRKE